MRVYTRIGDVFQVKIGDNSKKYFQYIANDLTQLNSNVIRVFRKEYPIDEIPELTEIVAGETEFYAHCVVRLGVLMGYWEKTGSHKNIGEITHIVFRDSSDYGNPEIKISHNWWVWRINEEQKRVGALVGDDQNAEIGLVFNPESISDRIKTGAYPMKAYPGY